MADRLIREHHDAETRQRQQSVELGQFLESSIDYATPKVMTPAIEGLKIAIGLPGELEKLSVPIGGRRKFRVRAISKSGVQAVITAEIVGRAPAVSNPQDVNFVWSMVAEITIPGRAKRVVEISPYRANSVQRVPSADFIAQTIATAIKEMLV